MADVAGLTEQFKTLATTEAWGATSAQLVDAVKKAGAASLAGVADKLKASLEDAASPVAREGAAAAVAVRDCAGASLGARLIALRRGHVSQALLLHTIASRAAPD